MKDSNSFVYNVWLIILLVAAYVWPIFGLVPAIYLFTKRNDDQLKQMKGWISLSLIWQIVLWLLLIIAVVAFVASRSAQISQSMQKCPLVMRLVM